MPFVEPAVPVKHSQDPSFVPEVESLRGLAALTVLVGHCYVFVGRPTSILTSIPMFGRDFIEGILNPQPPVLLFFTISGFVLGIQIRKSFELGIYSYPSFVIRRLFRLLPAMWVSVVLAAFLFFYVDQPSSSADVLYALLFIDFRINPVLWSLYVELTCSLLMPLLYFVSERLTVRGNLVLLSVFSLLMLWPGVPFGLNFLAFFHAGLLVGRSRSPFFGLADVRWSTPALLVATVAYVWAPDLLVGAGRIWTLTEWWKWMWLEVPACFVILWLVVHPRSGWFLNCLRLGPARRLGRISYSLYLFHCPIIFAALALLSRAGVRESVNHSGLYLLVVTITVLTATIPLAVISYRLVEKPANSLGRRLTILFLGEASTERLNRPRAA